MSAFTILCLCLLGALALIIGYFYTIKEFRYMTSHPDEFSDIYKKEDIRIIE